MGILAKDFDVSIRTPADIRPAAVQLRQAVESVGPFLIIPCDDLSCSEVMVDSDGKILAEDVFGWKNKSNWYKNKTLALRDPISEACRCESEPFYFKDGRFVTSQTNDLLNFIDLSHLNEFIDFDPASGIIVPVHMAMGTIGALALYIFESDFDVGAVFQQYADDLFILGCHFINGYRKVSKRYRQLAVSNLHLTKHEVQCLKWAAFGKTDEEIALILKRSPATIRFHLNKAATKLNTSNRPQTVVKATQLGFIGQYYKSSSKLLDSFPLFLIDRADQDDGIDDGQPDKA